MSFSNFSSYLAKKNCQQQNYCCIQGPSGEQGPQGPSGNGFSDISGAPPQMAFFDTTTAIYSTPAAQVSGNQILFGGPVLGNAMEPSISFLLDASAGIYLQATSAVFAGGPFPAIGPGPTISVDGEKVMGFGIAGFTPNHQVGQWLGDFINITGNIYTNAVDPAGKIQTYNGGKIISGNTATPVMGAGLIRASSTPTADWEDGHLGNSEAIFFTAADFIQGSNAAGEGANTVVRAPLPAVGADDRQDFGISRTAPGGWGGGLNVVVNAASTVITGPKVTEVATTVGVLTTDANFDYIVGHSVFGPTPYVGITTNSNSVLVAQKIIPKGFIMASGTSRCTIFTNATVPLTNLAVWKQTIAAAAGPPALLQSQAPYTTNAASNTFMDSAIGMGNTAVIIVIDLGVAFTTANGLIGATITMQRV